MIITFKKTLAIVIFDGFHVDLITNYGDEDHYNYDDQGIGLGKSTANHEKKGGSADLPLNRSIDTQNKLLRPLKTKRGNVWECHRDLANKTAYSTNRMELVLEKCS